MKRQSCVSSASVTGAVIVLLFLFYQKMFINIAEGAVAEKSCKSVMGDLTKRQLGGIATCTKSMKFKNGKDKAKKMNCILKCVMTTEGLLSADGYFSKDQIDVLLTREFPPSLIDKANTTFSPCSDVAVGKLDPNPETDEFCKTYDPFIKCLFGALPNLCVGT